MRRLPAALLAVGLAACATAGGGGGLPLPYDDLLGPWEIGEVGRELVTGTIAFVEGNRGLLQCGTVGQRDPASLPVEVRPLGNGWRFRGCEGEVTLRLQDDGTIRATLEYSEQRPQLVGSRCTRWEDTETGRRCVETDQIMGSRTERRTRDLSFKRPGG